MDIKKRVDKLYTSMRLSKMKTEFIVIDKTQEPPPLKPDVIQIVLAL
jgi:hypothetical protein